MGDTKEIIILFQNAFVLALNKLNINKQSFRTKEHNKRTNVLVIGVRRRERRAHGFKNTQRNNG